jgi:hypothetical protein
MSNKDLIITLSCLLFYFNSHAQSTCFIYAEGDYNFFNMSDLKVLQNEVLDDFQVLNIHGEIVHSYPPYYGFEIGLLFPLSKDTKNKTFIGGQFAYTSTGGRIDYRDYTGELTIDQVAVLYSFGGALTIRQPISEIFFVDFGFSLKLLVSAFRNSTSLHIGEGKQLEELNFSSLSFAIEPKVVPSIKFNQFSLGLAVSYSLAVPSRLEYENYDEAYLIHKNGEKAEIDWGGLNYGIVIGVMF